MITKSYNSKDVLPFTYLVSLTLGALASGTTTLTMEANSWFEHHFFYAWTDQADQASPVAARFTVQATDQSTGRQMASAKVPQNIFTAPWNQVPASVRPVKFAPNSVIQFDVTNLVNGTLNLSIAMWGYKVFTNAIL